MRSVKRKPKKDAVKRKENEKIYTDIRVLEDIPYFSTLILKKGGINQWKKFIS